MMRNSLLDPASRGWARYGDGDSCDFCAGLIGRGAVYTSATARFASHDRCGCVAGPAFADAARVHRYVPSDRFVGKPRARQVNNARVREWLAPPRS